MDLTEFFIPIWVILAVVLVGAFVLVLVARRQDSNQRDSSNSPALGPSEQMTNPLYDQRTVTELRDSTGKNLGPPSLELGSLQIWVFGRQFPDAHDRWHGNWLNVAVHCGGDGASVWTSGAILDTLSFSEFRNGLREIYESLSGEAVLKSVEPEIRVQVSASDSLGHLRLRVEINHIRSDNLHGHWFEFGVDQTYLPPVISQLDDLLKAFPVRESLADKIRRMT